jgi:hypothetical protein
MSLACAADTETTMVAGYSEAISTQDTGSGLGVVFGELDCLGGNFARLFPWKTVSNQDRGEIQHHGVGDPLLSLVKVKNGGHILRAPFRSSLAAKPQNCRNVLVGKEAK